MTRRATVLGSDVTDFRIVLDDTGEPVMSGKCPSDNNGVDRASASGKMDLAAAWRLADTLNARLDRDAEKTCRRFGACEV
jgi:hypothetical protein